jgi:hypothetical protein
VETWRSRQYALSMLLATSRPHKVLDFTGTDTLHGHVVYASPFWAVVLVYVAILGLLITGVWVMARAARRMSRPGRIVVGLIAVYALVGAVVAFLDAYRPTGDWRGGIVEGSFIVLYGLVAAGIVWAVDKAAKRLRASSLA